MARPATPDTLMRQNVAGQIDRREFVRRAVALGCSASAIARKNTERAVLDLPAGRIALS